MYIFEILGILFISLPILLGLHCIWEFPQNIERTGRHHHIYVLNQDGKVIRQYESAGHVLLEDGHRFIDNATGNEVVVSGNVIDE